MTMMKPKKKTKNNLCSRDCDPAFSFLLKIKKEIYLRNISRAISCLQTNLLANVIITSIILYVKRFKEIHSLQINSSILLLFYSFYVIY